MTISDLRRAALLDADPAFRTKATQILEGCGAAVEIAASPEALLESATPPDLLIVSLDRMTEKPDRWLASLRETARSTRVLLVTGFLRLEEAVRLLDLGADDLALKPVIWGHFRHVVLRLLAPPADPAPSMEAPPPTLSLVPPPELPEPPAAPAAMETSPGVSPAEYATALHPFATSLRLILDGQLGAVPPEIRSVLELLHGGLDWLDEIAREDLARSLGAEAPPPPGPVSIYPLLEWVSEFFNPVAYVRQVEIAAEPPPGPLETVTDPHGLTLVLQGLVSQAIHESRPGDEVRLSCTREDERIVIEITDTAPTTGEPARLAEAGDTEASGADRAAEAVLEAAHRRAGLLGATLERTTTASRRTAYRLSLPVIAVTPEEA